MHVRPVICWVFVALMLSTGKLPADNTQIEQLIDQLVNVSEPGFGYSVYFAGSEFLPYEDTGEIGTLVLGRAQRGRSAALCKIVEQGADAVPALLKHIGDNREIKMKPVSGMEWMQFSDEYDFNRRTRKIAPQGVNRDHFGGGEDQPDRHAITIGDLCFVALGQIVNRNYSATRYQPSGGMIVSSPTYSEALRKVIIEDWSGLTRERHKNLLIDDFVNPDHEGRRIGAYLRLACYYPETVEPLILKQLAEPRYDAAEVSNFIRERLYGAKDAEERKGAFDAFIAKRGEVARQGILLDLFHDLDTQEADEQGRLSPRLKEKYDVRVCLAELYGYPREVKSKDEPPLFPLEQYEQACFIAALTHDPSQRVGDAVRKIFLEFGKDRNIGPACLTCLASRGYGPFLVEQLNKIDVADSKGDPLHEKYIEAIAKSQAPDVRSKLFEIVKTTANDRHFMAALPAIDRSNDQLILKLARELVANLPEETNRGKGLLKMIGERFPDQAKAIYKSFLITGSANRAGTMCNVLWDGNPMSVEILAPLLDDKRSLPGFERSLTRFTSRLRICDRAATAISQTSKDIRFDSDWGTDWKDQQIEKLRQYCRESVKQ